MKIFRAVTSILAFGLFVSAVMHTVLLMSDSEQYRNWVVIQMALQLAGVGLLLLVRQFKFWALVIFAVLSVPGIYINAVYVNYGNGPATWVVPLLFWCVYGWLAVVARRQYSSKMKHMALNKSSKADALKGAA